MKKALFLALVLLVSAATALPAVTTIKTVAEPGDLPRPLSDIVRKGDFLVSDGKYTAVVAVSPRPAFSTINYGHPDVSGYLLAFLPEGASQRVEAQMCAPSVRVNGKAVPVGSASVRQEAGSIIALSSLEGEGGLKLEVRTRYRFVFAAGRIDIVAEVRNTGRSEATGLSFGLGASACQSFNFSPYNAKSFPKLNFRVWQRPDHALGWFNPNPVETSDNPLPGRLRPGQAHSFSYSVVSGSTSVEVLQRLYALAGVKADPVSFEFPQFDGLAEVIIREPATGSVFFRAFMERPSPLAVPLPPGTYSLRANLFPAVIETSFTAGPGSPGKPVAIKAPVLGRVKVAVKDKKGRPALGKVSFIGLAPTQSPYFRPENPVMTGRAWESSKNSVFPLRQELEVVLPAGTYLVASSRGPEYTRDERVVEIFEGDNPPLEFRLERAVAVRGLVSLDPHMHTQNSDGSIFIPDRLRSVVAEGLDVAVSADHNFITDYLPDLEKLGLEDDLAVIAGSEVTTRTGSIHYNAFPDVPRPDLPGNGAVSVRDETPDTLFRLSRAKSPAAVIQVNHPRSEGLGYFLTYDLDPESAASAKAPFSMDFEVMEVMNGAKPYEANCLSTEDWFHFLNRGYPVRAVGSSDSHDIDGSEPGYARTYVFYEGPSGKRLDRDAFIRALKEGRSFVSNGPIVLLKVNGKAGPGELVRAKKGRVKVDLRVLGAPWLDVSEVLLVVNGVRQEPLPMKGADGKTVKFRDRVRLELERDAWVAVEVRGRSSLYPVVQQRSDDGLAESAAYPYALTNPVLVDVDGDGRSEPVRPGKVSLR